MQQLQEMTHLTIGSAKRLPLFPTEKHLRRAVRRVARVAGPRLALFGLIPTHLHLLALVGRAAAGRLMQAVALSLRTVAAARLAPGFPRPVEDHDHLDRLLRYFLRQTLKHKVPGHPALWTGSCLPDLTGARLVPGLHGLRDRLELVLKDVSDERLYREACLVQPPCPAGRDEVVELKAGGLVDAVARTFAVGPDLLGRSAQVVLVRRVAAHIGRKVGLAPTALAEALGISGRTLRSQRAGAVTPAQLRAVSRMIGLRRAASARAVELPQEEDPFAA